MARRTDRPVTGDIDRCPNESNYSRGCRCPSCTARATLYNQRYRRNVAERQWGVDAKTTRVDPEPSLKALWEAYAVRGYSFADIARTVGLAQQTVHDLYYQRRQFVTKETHDKIMSKFGPGAPRPRPVTQPNTLVDFKPHLWKVEGLYAQGWTTKGMKKILTDAGRPAGFLHTHSQQKLQARYSSVQSLDWLVATIGDRLGPSACNRRRMARRGVFPLIHYTDEGALIRESLTEEQKQLWRERVQ